MMGSVKNDMKFMSYFWQKSASKWARNAARSVKRVHPTAYMRFRSLILGREQAVPHRILPEYGQVVEIDGISLRIDQPMSTYNINKLMAGFHTVHERKLLESVLTSEDVVMELGGGIGTVAITCAKRVGSNRVFVYEANPELEILMRENFSLNSVHPELKMCILGKNDGTAAFYVAEHFSRSSTYNSEGDGVKIDVAVLSFNDEIRRIRPTVLVVDIQGGEAELLEYADLSSVTTLLIELHPDVIGFLATMRCRRRLRDHGFVETDASGNSFVYRRKS